MWVHSNTIYKLIFEYCKNTLGGHFMLKCSISINGTNAIKSTETILFQLTSIEGWTKACWARPRGSYFNEAESITNSKGSSTYT